MRATTLAVAVLFVLLAVSSLCFGQVPVTDDTYVSGSIPTTPNGTSPSLVVQTNGWTLIRFDVSGLPANAKTTLQKATVKLYVTAATASGTFNVYEVSSAWKEGTVTYNTKPGYAGAILSTGTISSTTSKSTYVLLDITAAVQDWLNNPANNNGIVLIPASGSVSVTFESKESTSTSHSPELSLVYGVATVSGSGPISSSGGANPTVSLTGVVPKLNGGTGQDNSNLTFPTSGVIATTDSTNASVAAEAAVRAAADNTLTNNLNAEITNRQNAVTGEANTRSAADTALANSVSAETSLRQTGDTTLQGNIDTLSSTVATNLANGLATKADINKPVLSVASLPTLPCTENAMVLLQGAPIGQQLYVCRNEAGSFSWALVNNDQTLSGSVDAEVARATAAETTLQTNINNEQAARTAADSTLTTNLNTEVTRAQGAEQTLTSNLTAEANRAQAAETALSNSLSAETTRAQGAEATLTSNLNAEVSARQAAVNAEATRAQTAESALATSVAGEVIRAQSAESTLTNSVAAEATRATDAETNLASTKADINKPVLPVASLPTLPCTENAMVLLQGAPIGQQLYVCRNDAGNFSWALVNNDQTLSGSVDAEVARATAAEATLQTNINNEQAARAAADSSLTTNLNNEVTRAQGAENTEIAARQAAVTSETNRATAAEGTLTTNLGTEVARAQSAEGAEVTRAQTAEATLTGNLAAEASRAQVAEGALATSVAGEASRAQTAETALTNSVSAETTRATAAETVLTETKADLHKPVEVAGSAPSGACTSVNALQMFTPASGATQLYVCKDSGDGQNGTWAVVNDTATIAGDVFALKTDLTTEVARATGAENTLTAHLGTETTERTTADNTLTTNLNAEIARATGAETANLAAAKGYTDTAVNAETARATAAEGNLNTSINNVGTALTAESDRAKLAEQEAKNYADTAVTAEATARTNADAGLQTSIAGVGNALASEATRATAAEGVLTTNLANEVTRATDAEATKADLHKPIAPVPALPASCQADEMVMFQGAPYVCRLDSNSQLAFALVSNDAAVTGSVDAEKTRAMAAEATLQTHIDAANTAISDEASARAAADTTLTSNLNNEVTRATTAEANALTDAKAYTNNAVGAEATRAQGAEAALGTRVDGVSTALSFESSRAQQAEAATLTSANQYATNAVNAENTRATGAESALSGAITTAVSAEATRAQGVEATLAAGITGVQTNLTAESALRLQGDADTLASAKTYADAGLGTKVTFKGAFASGPYKVNDVVTFNGASYVALSDNNGNVNPDTDTANWAVMAAKGIQGDKGDQGIQGIQGVQGDKGDQGIQGIQGLKGDKGDTGAQGPQGIQGPIGETGATGPMGPIGPQGPQGIQGPAGADGKDGVSFTYKGTFVPGAYAANDVVTFDGASYIARNATTGDPASDPNWALMAAKGNKGDQGDKGDTGAVGATGPQGPQGDVGPQGLKGDKGDTGATGATGPQGPEGPQGPQGLKGDTGATGPQGPQGIQGPIGPTGPQGSQGIQGVPGVDGAQGAPGAKGDPGQGFNFTGALVAGHAYQAYDVLTYGGQTYQVTGAYTAPSPVPPAYDPASDGLVLLAQKGDKGADGTQGPTGPAGADGATGPQGPKGDTGAQGPSGVVAANAPLSYNGGTQTVSISQASGSTAGFLSAADWTTFNNKQAALNAGSGISITSNTVANTGVLSVSGTANQVSASTTNGAVTLSLPASINVNTTGSAASFTGSLAGDVTGTQSATTVGKLQGRTVAGTTPNTNDVLKWNGSQWAPAADANAGGTVTSVATGTGLTGGPITSTGTISLANTAVAPGTYSAANITVDAQGRITAASSNTIPSGTVTSVATGNGLTGGPVTSSGTINMTTAQMTRTVCYIAGGDNAATTLTTTDSQDSFFRNMVGAMHVTAASCQVDAGSVTFAVYRNNSNTAGNTVVSNFSCTSTPGNWGSPTVSNFALSENDSLDLGISAVTTAKRLTVCLKATVD